MKIRIAIADDHAIVRDGIRLLATTDAAFEFVFEAADAESFLKLARLHDIDIAVLDLQMPEMNGLQLAAELMKINESMRILIFSGQTDEKSILDAVEINVSGFISKDASLTELKAAFFAIHQGEQYFSMKVGEVLYKSFLQKKNEKPELNPVLSDRELEVLKGFADGKAYKEIATGLFISPRTVETHKENIMKKLGLNSLADLIKYAIRHKIISID